MTDQTPDDGDVAQSAEDGDQTQRADYWRRQFAKLDAINRDLERRLSRFVDPALPEIDGVLVKGSDESIRLFREAAGWRRDDGVLHVTDGNDRPIALFDSHEWSHVEFVFSRQVMTDG